MAGEKGTDAAVQVGAAVLGEVAKYFLRSYFDAAKQAGMTQGEIDAQIMAERDQVRDRDPERELPPR